MSSAQQDSRIQDKDLIEQPKLIKPLVLQYNNCRREQTRLSVIDEIQELDGRRFKETKRAQAMESEIGKPEEEIYDNNVMMDVVGICECGGHIFDWNQYGKAAFGFFQKVYLIDPLEQMVDIGYKTLDVCSSEQVITAVKWMNTISSLEDPLNQCVLAVAVSPPQANIQLWNAYKRVQLRSISIQEEFVTCLSWDANLLAVTTQNCTLTVHDVSRMNSLVFKERIYSIQKIRHCSFSAEKHYFSVCDKQVMIFNLAQDQSSLDGTVTCKKELCLEQPKPVEHVAWSLRVPQMFCFGTMVPYTSNRL